MLMTTSLPLVFLTFCSMNATFDDKNVGNFWSQVRELLEAIGELRGFNLVKDEETGNSKLYAFCAYQNLSVTDIACAALNGIKMEIDVGTCDTNASAILAGAAAAVTAGQVPGATPAIPGMFQNMFPLASGQFGALPVMPVQAMTQQDATRHARRVYVGGLSPSANEQTVATFFSHVMSAIGGNTAGPGDAVVNVYINHEKKFAFVEMRSVEEASNAMALDGIIFEGVPVKVRRPIDYNPSLAAALGPSQPNPNLNLAAVGLSPGSAGGLKGPDRIFVDRETGNSKGYAFCVYQDSFVTDIACAALNGIKMGDKILTLRRVNQAQIQPEPEQESILLHAQQQIAFQRMMLQPKAIGTPPTKIVSLTQMV
ncbi:hypothetical protein L1987_47083 [Smallanthus sonchifolius]|uniref:Uncharacterized protein n=1 Tax=Smallanthus sonchifolius TaxID=185202 RepID=A0ACB9G180_9ASTR|nr:hypothetical protein L1987_47083 [Smallanthus sonchifolius]